MSKLISTQLYFNSSSISTLLQLTFNFNSTSTQPQHTIRVSHNFPLSELKFDWVKKFGVWPQQITMQKDFLKKCRLGVPPDPSIFSPKMLNLPFMGYFPKMRKWL